MSNIRQILYQLSHKGSPRILEWVPYPFSSRSSRPRNQTKVSCNAGRFFTKKPNWAIREASVFFRTMINMLQEISHFSVYKILYSKRVPWWLRWQRICLQCRKPRCDPWVRNIPWRREWQLTPVFLPGESYGQRSLEGYTVHGVAKSQTQMSD